MAKSMFFGYPERPFTVPDVMRTAAQALTTDATLDVEVNTWQDLEVDGRVVIRKVLDAIDACDVALFDLSAPNPNVLFETGYAIGRGLPVILTLDSTNRHAKTAWSQLAILKEIGYTPYRNSKDLEQTLRKLAPWDGLRPVYDDFIEPALPSVAAERNAVLYCTTFEPFEASNRLSSMIESRQRRGQRFIVSDPGESGLSPLSWFVVQSADAAGVLVSFAGDSRNQSLVHNNRHALVAGLAMGLEIPVFLLAEEDYSAPFDYEALLSVYETAEECVAQARGWLDGLEFDGRSWETPRASLQNSLAGLRFGEHVAENERSDLSDYFLETAAFHEVVAARDAIFVGHRGTGKTANAMQAFDRIAGNKENLAILIKPPGFEFPAILDVVERLPDLQRDYFFDALWRFVIQSEMGSTVLAGYASRNKNVPFGADEQAFIEYADAAPFDMRAEVSVRLEQALNHLVVSLDQVEGDSASRRNLINEAFHTQALSVLRARLGNVLKSRKRVAVFVDNLDKGWERGADFHVMARFILGLLTAKGRVVQDFEREDHWRDAIKLTVAVFLRSDIYNYLRTEAREPDKLPISTISWKDCATLRTVINSRFLNSRSLPAKSTELWSHYFCEYVGSELTSDYMFNVTMPRPRDVVFFANAAVGRAIDRQHQIVGEDDFLAAEEVYSQYAYEALLVENGVTIPEMEDALLGFLDDPEIADRQSRVACLRESGISADRIEPILDKLISMSFFGIETRAGEFEFPEVGSEAKVAFQRSRRLQSDEEQRRFTIHPAFHKFLGVKR